MQKAIAGSIWFVTCLLCVSILSASVDPLPDPPAVKPERVDAKADCLGELQTTPPKPSEAAALVGDGAAAVLLSSNRLGEQPVRLGEVSLHVDGSVGNLLRVEVSPVGVPELHMNGIALAGRAIHAMAESVLSLLQRNGRSLAEVSAIVTHGGNGRMPALLALRLGVDPERVWSATHATGNLGSASLPVAWAMREPKPDGLIVWTAVGAGLMWGAALLGE